MANVLEEGIKKEWCVLQAGPFFACYRVVENSGYQLEGRVTHGFLFHKPSTSEYATLTAGEDLSHWELIHFNYRPDVDEARANPDWKP